MQYDVSLVDGFSVTMTLTNNADCPEASCTSNIKCVGERTLDLCIPADFATAKIVLRSFK